MASPYLTEQAGLIQSPEIVGLERQRKLADLLTSQAFQSPQGQMISGHYVKPATTQQLQPLLSALLATNMNQNIDEKQLAMAQKLKALGGSESADILSTLVGQQGQPESIQQGPTQTGGNIPIQPGIASQAPNPMAALLKAQSAQSPEGKAYVAPLLANVIPKTPESIVEFNAMKDNPQYKAWKDQLTPMQQAQLKNEEQKLKFEASRVGMEGSRLGLENQKFQLEKQKIEQELSQGKPLTEFQGKAVAYGIAMQDASNNMKKIEDKGFNPASLKNQTSVSMAGGTAGNLLVSPEARQYKQAQDQFAEAYLRFKSGANTPEPEIQRNLRNMMPAVGDDRATLNQKQNARNEAARAMAIASGPAGANKIQNPVPMSVGQPNVQVSPAPTNQVPQTGGWKVIGIQ